MILDYESNDFFNFSDYSDNVIIYDEVVGLFFKKVIYSYGILFSL